MNELRPLDTGFIELEDADRRISLGIAVTAVLAGPPPRHEEFAALLNTRIADIPRLRQRVRRTALDLAAPEWEDDVDFDLARHLRWVTLPRPAQDSTLWELVAAEIEERLDRDRPLWECVAVEGLAGDRWAVILKAHHSLVDGISGVAVFETLCDPRPGDDRRVRRFEGVREEPQRPGWAKLPAALPAAVVGTVRSLVPVGAALLGSGPVSSLNGPIGHRRRYTAVRVSLPVVSGIGAVYHVTVNDVVLAAITAGYRELLLGRAEEPAAHTLRILVPVSMRAEHAKHVMDNRVSAVLPDLPVGRADPVDRLRVVHMTMEAHKSGGAPGAEHLVLGLARGLPFAAVAWTLRLAARFPQHGVAGLATNVPGPRHPLALQGRPVLELVPAVPIAMRLRTAIAILSYHDHLVFGITGDYDSTPDIDVLAAGIRGAVQELAERAGCGVETADGPDGAPSCPPPRSPDIR
ncbi:wax ester/triacylglycerol synthase family O-acyltransferase [Nocardia sienata]|uniref:wax ester/triacylglycerol synthase family O-acyltransferase n=1 Tax=Nocardia sienata TaxID=248552 RepID=UPI0009FD3C31|nr:wax ester/triacylglycerol synthase family O-acyltransferase [Nocardia sienata]